MKYIKCNLLIFSFLFSITIYAQIEQGKVIESEELKSELLNESVRYSVYLPPNYENTNRKYPVIYLLHGYTGSEIDWIQFGEMDRKVDVAIAAGTIPPMIIIMPDARNTWYVNDHKKEMRYEDFFIEELMPFVEKKYRIRQKKEFRGILGLSMGGYGSLLYALKHPDLFAACAPLSAAIYTETTVKKYKQSRWDEVEGPMYGKGLAGENRINDHWKNNNPFYLVEKGDLEKLKSVQYFFDCGDDDFLYEGNSKFHILLRDKKIPHEFRIRDGAHTWEYWRTGLIPALEFIGKSFTR